MRRSLSPSLVGVLACLLVGACSSSGGGGAGGKQKPQPRSTAKAAHPQAPVPAGPHPSASDVADTRDVGIQALTPQDTQDFTRAWRLFVTHDPGWESAREEWLAKGGAAPYVLSENLFRYFWSASRCSRKAEVLRVAENAKRVGEPAVAYFAKALITDKWPLKEPVTAEVFNPDNIMKPIKKTFTHYDIDDTTRQHTAHVLAMIGEPAEPTLSSPAVLQSPIRAARVYAAYALGAIGNDAAVATLGGMLRSEPDWQVRGAAAKSLGFALRKNPSARAPLEAAARDPDPFVQKKVAEALAGKSRIEF